MLVENRLFTVGPVQLRFDRMLRGETKSLPKTVTFGAALANGLDPDPPPTHVVGIDDGSVAYALQSGTGVAFPTHVTCWTALGSPVLSSAEPTVLVPGRFWKIPMPPRTTAR